MVKGNIKPHIDISDYQLHLFKIKQVPRKRVKYSFRIEKELINNARKKARKLSISTSAFIRQAIWEKLNS